MTNEPCSHPDLLRRFVAAPYIFRRGNGTNQLCIESNDLEIALKVRDSVTAQLLADRVGGLYCRLIRDRDLVGPVDGTEISVVTDGALRVLHHGQQTILIHDIERSELLGFVSRCLEAHTLVSSLILVLLDLP